MGIRRLTLQDLRATIIMILMALYAIALTVAPTSIAHASETETPYPFQNTVPAEYVGRWVIMNVDGYAEEQFCETEGWAAADLVIAPSAAVNSNGAITVLRTMRLPDAQTLRVDLAWVSDDKVTVGSELWTLTPDKQVLEIASAPQMGWEVSRFQRCTPPPSDGSLSELPLPSTR